MEEDRGDKIRDAENEWEKDLSIVGEIFWKIVQHWNVIFSDEMTIAIKPEGYVKVLGEISETWVVYCSGYLGQEPSHSLKLMVLGTIT